MSRSGDERLPRLLEAELDQDQRAVYRSITSGPRASGSQWFALTNEEGALNGPFGIMLHAPALGLILQELGAAIRYRTTLDDRGREVAVLMTAAITKSDFERYAHVRAARATGLTDEEIEDLDLNTFNGVGEAEQALVRLCRLLLTDRAPDDREYAALKAALGEKQIIEVTVLVGYYRTLAQMMHVFAVGAPTKS